MSTNTNFPNGLNVGDAADELKVNSVIVPQELEVSFFVGPTSLISDRVFFVATQAYQVTKASCWYNTAESTGGSCFARIDKLTSTTGVTSGTALLTNNSNAGFNLKATPKTTQTGTLTTTTANLQLAAGDRLVMQHTGTLTELADLAITVSLKRI